MPEPTAIVYIDGLNLQRRLVDEYSTGVWIDYWALAEAVLPNFDLVEVNVFTSQITSPEVSAALSIWQKQMDLHSGLNFHLGRMKKTTRLYPLAESFDGSVENRVVKVLKYEEKGSDVSLAANMVWQASQHGASIFYVMTSDTDFEPLLRLLKNKLGVRVGVLCPTSNLPKLFVKLELDDIRHVKAKHIRIYPLKSLSP